MLYNVIGLPGHWMTTMQIVLRVVIVISKWVTSCLQLDVQYFIGIRLTQCLLMRICYRINETLSLRLFYTQLSNLDIHALRLHFA